MKQRQHAVMGWLVLAAAGLVLHVHQLLGGRPYFRDSLQVYVPAKMWLAQRLNAGEIPLWWPWDGGGSSLIPQPVFSVFHPSTLAYLILPFWGAFAFQDLAATWLALFGAYALARTLGIPRPGAIISGALYGLSGYLVCLSEHQFMKLAAGTMPWYLAALLVADRRRGRWLAAPAAAMALLLLTGDPQIAILASASGLVLMLVRSRNWKRALATGVLSPFVGALLSAIQIVPSLSVLPDTERGHPMHYDRWALLPSHLLGMIAPVNHGMTQWVRSTFFGWAGICLVLASFAGGSRRRRTVAALWVLTLASIWVSLGSAYGLHRVAQMVVPIWSQLRYPMKSIVVAFLMLSVLAGYGATQVWSLQSRRKALRFVAIGALLCAVISITVTGVDWRLATLAVPVVSLFLLRPELCALLVTTQSAAIAMPLMLTAPAEFYEPPPLALALTRDGVGLSGSYFDRPFDPPRDPSDWAASSRAGAGGLGTSLGAVFGLPSITPSMPGISWRLTKLFSEEHRDIATGRLLGAFGVGDVVLVPPIETSLQDQVIAREPEFDFVALRLRKHLQRAYVTQRAHAVAKPADAIEFVTGPLFAPGREVVLETDAPKPEWAARPLSPARPAEVVSRPDSSTVHVRAELDAPGFVVLNEAAFRGWKATLDGQPTPIFAANGLVRAVEAPAGVHDVVFRFEPPGWNVGRIVSECAWLSVLLFVWVARRPYRRHV